MAKIDQVVNGESGLSARTKINEALASVTKTDVGLGNADNTSDANKPVSTATQTALDGKATTAQGATADSALQVVTSDATLTGDGTVGNPLVAIAGVSGTGLSILDYEFGGVSADVDPLSGIIKVDNADPTLVTQIYVSKTDDNGDLRTGFGALSEGDIAGFTGNQPQNDGDFNTFVVIAAGVIDNSTYVTLNVVYVNSNASFVSGEKISAEVVLIPVKRFINLEDVDPANYVGQAGLSVVVNQAEDGLEFVAASGGGGSIIGDLRTLYVDDVAGFFVNDSETWLRTGVTSTDTGTYPDAKVTIGTPDGASYSGTSVTIGAQDGNPQGLTFDGVGWRVSATLTDRVYEYDIDFVYSTNNFTTVPIGNPKGITLKGVNFWVVDSESRLVNEYSFVGVPTGGTFSVAVEIAASSAQDMVWNGSSFWFIDKANNLVREYDADGVYLNNTFSYASEQTAADGMCWDGGNFWILGTSPDAAFQYDADGVYTGNSFVLDASNENASAIGFDGADFWVIGTADDTSHKYNATLSPNFVGIADEKFDVSTGVPVYVRIK